MKLAQQMYIAELLDFYGGMLTDSQVKIVRGYVDYNASLGELANECGITRQAVSDMLRRSIAKLESFEAKMGLVGKYHLILQGIPARAREITTDADKIEEITAIFTQLFKTLED